METKYYKISLTNTAFLGEIVLITVSLVFLLINLRNNPIYYKGQPVLPFILLSAATVPTLLRRKNLSSLGLHLEGHELSLWLLCRICMVTLPALVCGILLLNNYKIALPLCPVIPEKSLISWLIYQFLCVAFAEEVFFRGYLQSNIQCYLSSNLQKNPAISALTGIIFSAAIFALFHFIVSGNAISLITFLPGLIFGWLFYRTRSLLAPVLFHGLANVAYGLFAVLFA